MTPLCHRLNSWQLSEGLTVTERLLLRLLTHMASTLVLTERFLSSGTSPQDGWGVTRSQRGLPPD